MKIISKFHDYYDSVAKKGQDFETIYQRTQSFFEINNTKEINELPSLGSETMYLKVPKFSPKGERISSESVDRLFVGFCGKIYPALKISSNNTYFWDAESFINYAFENYEHYSIRRSSSWRIKVNNNDAQVKEFFEQTNNKKLLGFFTEYNTPVFICTWQRKEWALYLEVGTNPSLKDISFVKVKDPFSAYQEIYQFISSSLSKGENEMVKISDKDKIHKHGFDKWSFRKMGKNSK